MTVVGCAHHGAGQVRPGERAHHTCRHAMPCVFGPQGHGAEGEEDGQMRGAGRRVAHCRVSQYSGCTAVCVAMHDTAALGGGGFASGG